MAGDADVMFDGDWVVVEGRWAQFRTWDLMLDAPDRRSGASSSTYRRALVHGFDDDLAINFDRDYPGGVTIHGEVRIPDKLVVNAQDLMQVLNDLHSEIRSLKNRIEELESGVPNISELRTEVLSRFDVLEGRVLKVEKNLPDFP